MIATRCSRLLARGALALALLCAATAAHAQLAPAVPPAQENAPPPSPSQLEAVTAKASQVWEASWAALHGQSLTVGAGYTQGTLKFPRFRGEDTTGPQITDNGRITPLLQYDTTERYFWEYPLTSGRVAIGYNFTFTYAGLAVNRQLRTNAFQGEDLGTAVTGDYLLAAPFLFLRMGPLYPDSAIFWKLGFGVGGGIARLKGDVRPYAGALGEPAEAVDSKGAVPVLYNTATWELDLGRWLVVFRAVIFSGKADEDPFVYEEYALSAGYRVRF